jgi:DNA-binding transcriptional MerR regulator
MRSIGELARASGLTVSALRFYDGAGVLTPARVDPHTGYRWYGPEQLADARLLSRLRRVGLPLAETRLVLAAPPGSGEAHRILERHLCRLEDGLADARRELSTVRALLDRRETPMTDPTEPVTRTATRTATRLTVRAEELAAALDAVRFAVADAPEFPMLNGVLFDVDGGVLRLVATDRYRLAVAQAPAPDRTGPEASALLPAPVVDGIRALLGGADEATVVLDGGRVALEARGRRIEGTGLDQDFPDYRRLIRVETAHRADVSAAVLRDAVANGATRATPDGHEVTVLALGPQGTIGIAEDGDATPGPRVAVNRRFLLDAIDAGAAEQLVLEFGDPITPLAIRDAGNSGSFSILMPVRLSA